MTLNEQVKILDHKILANKAQYDLDRQAAKISALSIGELEKYEYLTGEDLGYKPDIVQKAKFEYSALGQVYSKRLNVDERKEGLLKRLKNIEGKNEQQLQAIRDQEEKQLDLIGRINTEKNGIYDKGNKEAVKVVNKSNKVSRENRNKNFVCAHSNGTQYDFNQYRDLNQYENDIYNGELSINDAKNEQNNVAILINELKNYGPTNPKKVKSRQEVLGNANRPYAIRNDIINGFKNKIFTTKQAGTKDISKSKSEESDITDMPELENEKSTKQKKTVKKI